MVVASIVVNQAGKSAGVPSQSRDDLDLGVSVVLTNNNNTGVVSWLWEFVSKPVGSLATIFGAALPSASFTPDVRGSYLVTLTVDGSPSNPATDTRIAAVRTAFLGIRKPATSERKEFDPVDGWSAAQQAMIDAIDVDAALGLRKDGANQPTADIGWGAHRITGLGGLENEGTLRLGEVADPSSAPDKGFLYAKDDSGDTELFYMDDGGAVVQITRDGYLDVVSLQGDSLPAKLANGFLKRNAGNTAWEEVIYGSAANTVCQGDDGRLSDSRAPTGAAGGQLGGTYPDPDVRGLRETAGPTLLSLGAILNGQALVRDGSSIIGSSTVGGSGGKVKIRVDDMADGYLHGKLITGPGMSFAIGSPGGNETLTIDAYGEMKVSVDDTTFGYLEDKLVAGRGITLATLNGGSNETRQIDGYGTKVSVVDTHIGFLQGKLVAGTNITLTKLNSGSNESLEITGADGIGAGGVLGETQQLASDSNDISGTSFADLAPTSLTRTFTAVANEIVDVIFCGWAASPYGLTTGEITLRIDGVDLTYTVTAFAGGMWERNDISFVFPLKLAAGSHTVTLRVKKTGGGDANWKVYAGAKIAVRQYRGGLVPVNEDGVPVVDVPEALNFAGPNVQVTNIGGVANIAFTGATGIVRSVPWWSGIPAEDAPTVTPTLGVGNYTVGCRFGVYRAGTRITGVSFYSLKTGAYTVRCKLWKYAGSTLLRSVDVPCGGAGRYDGYFSTPYEVSANEAPETQFYATMWETSGTNFTDIPATPYNESQYPMRGHIYWDRSQSYAAGDAFPASTSATQTFPVDPIVESVGDPAGFVQPENIPVLEYLSASQVRAKAALGAASALRLLLNDGVRYQAASPLALDLTVSGRGGLDTGSEAPNTWYYVYAVPSTTSGLFEILCSATPPPTGPTGYATWRYLGAFRNDASSNILVFYQDGASFRYSDRQRVAALGSGTDGAPVALSLAAHAPATARIVDVLWYYQAAGTAGQLIGWADGRQGGGGDNGQWQIRANCADNTFGSDTVAGSISTVTNPKQIYYQRLSSCNGALVDILGWLDGYLAALPSQLQAEYVPDTAQPQLAWRGNSRIDVLPAPGQPSTVLLTLQDGRQRNFSPSLVWDPSTGVADGGLDTGTEQASSWYYLYMVPRAGADDLLHVRGSLNAPPTGPTGYANWRYIGAARNNAASHLVRFWQIGTSFDTGTAFVEEIDDPSGSAITAVDLSQHVPLSALSAKMSWKCYSTSGYEIVRLFVDGYASTAYQRYHEGWVSGSSDENVGQVLVPVPTSPKRIHRQIDETSGNARYWVLSVDGWIDGYLGSAVGSGGGGPIGNTLDGAYDQGGAGAGRVIAVDAGAVELNASGGNALKLDGYMTLQEIATPASLGNRGLVYSQDDGGDTELSYRDDKGRSTRITADGYLAYGVLRDDSLDAAGGETSMSLAAAPCFASSKASGRDLDVYRNGLLLKWAAVPVGNNQWKYNAGAQSVEFGGALAASDWIRAAYRSYS